jgi:hypothetical protein
MNSLIFNPTTTRIPEWKDVYLSEEDLIGLENTIDQVCSYLTIISTSNRDVLSVDMSDHGNSATFLEPVRITKSSRFIHRERRVIPIHEEGVI